MEFKINNNQYKKLHEWKEEIKKEFGKYGQFKYAFEPNGIFTVVTVYSVLAKKGIDLTEYDLI